MAKKEISSSPALLFYRCIEPDCDFLIKMNPVGMQGWRFCPKCKKRLRIIRLTQEEADKILFSSPKPPDINE